MEIGGEAMGVLWSFRAGLLGIGGVCAAVALLLGVVRHFCFADEDGVPHKLISRGMHVLGTVMAMSLIAVGAAGLSERANGNDTAQGIVADAAGSGWMPGGSPASDSATLGEFLSRMPRSESGGQPDFMEEAAGYREKANESAQAFRDAAAAGDAAGALEGWFATQGYVNMSAVAANGGNSIR